MCTLPFVASHPKPQEEWHVSATEGKADKDKGNRKYKGRVYACGIDGCSFAHCGHCFADLAQEQMARE
jgi:hypothetical protein